MTLADGFGSDEVWITQRRITPRTAHLIETHKIGPRLYPASGKIRQLHPGPHTVISLP
jgi:hypothetical protein